MISPFAQAILLRQIVSALPLEIVIASEAKQSTGPQSKNRLLRRGACHRARIRGPFGSSGLAIDVAGSARQGRFMRFDILGEISCIETFATGSGIREIARLRRIYGSGRWRKRKGIARVRLSDGSTHVAEVTLVRGRRDWAQRIQNQAAAVRP
jgi:hypothetical protein